MDSSLNWRGDSDDAASALDKAGGNLYNDRIEALAGLGFKLFDYRTCAQRLVLRSIASAAAMMRAPSGMSSPASPSGPSPSHLSR